MFWLCVPVMLEYYMIVRMQYADTVQSTVAGMYIVESVVKVSLRKGYCVLGISTRDKILIFN